jgi:hypothetical protein
MQAPVPAAARLTIVGRVRRGGRVCAGQVSYEQSSNGQQGDSDGLA